jgi:hypothetical protein
VAAPTKRLVILMDGGVVEKILCDGVDLTGVTAIVVERDIEGADDSEIFDIEGKQSCFDPRDIVQASDDLSRDVRRAYDTWALT